MEKKEISKKEFALNQIAPYYHNPELCGIHAEKCSYLTPDGKMCVAGKNMKPFVRKRHFGETMAISPLLESYGHDGQKRVFIKSAQNILSNDEWTDLQILHDIIAEQTIEPSHPDRLPNQIEKTSLFTMEELINWRP